MGLGAVAGVVVVLRSRARRLPRALFVISSRVQLHPFLPHAVG